MSRITQDVRIMDCVTAHWAIGSTILMMEARAMVPLHRVRRGRPSMTARHIIPAGKGRARWPREPSTASRLLSHAAIAR